MKVILNNHNNNNNKNLINIHVNNNSYSTRDVFNVCLSTSVVFRRNLSSLRTGNQPVPVLRNQTKPREE